MKSFCLILCLTFIAFNSITSQSTLEVYVSDCRLDTTFEFLLEFRLYKNDILIKTIEPKHKFKQVIEDLEFGNYRIDYETMFNKKESILIQLKDRKIYTVDLCIDKLNYDLLKNKTFIDKLKNEDSYKITLRSNGCFHSREETIEIKKLNDLYFLSYNNYERVLTEEEVTSLRHFEMELKNIKSGRCTTTDRYILKYNRKRNHTIDNGCNWRGFYHLKNQLNFQKN